MNLPIDLLDAETKAQEGHPDILAAIAAERAADQAFNTLQAAVRPTLGFSVSANTKTGTGTTLDRDEVAAQLVFSSPLLSTNATSSTSRRIAASFKQAKLDRAEATRKTEVAAREAFRNWQSTGIRVDAVTSEIEAFRLVAKGIASEAQFGQKTTLDLLDAEKDVNDAELSLVSAEHNQLLAAFRLKAAIGSLTAEQMGLGDVLGQLADMPPTPSPFYNFIPIWSQADYRLDGIFSGLSGMFETVRAVSAPRKILSSSRKLMPLENVVWRSPDISAAAAEASPRNRHYGVCDLPDIIDLSEIVMNPSVVPSKVHWQNASGSDQAGKTAKTQASSQLTPTGESDQQSQNQPSSDSLDDLKSSLRQRLHARIDHWLDENMANLVEDALQATPQSRTKPVDKPE